MKASKFTDAQKAFTNNPTWSVLSTVERTPNLPESLLSSSGVSFVLRKLRHLAQTETGSN